MTIEEQIQASVEKSIEKLLPQQFDMMIGKIKEMMSLQTYTVKRAAEITGIGYRTILNAVNSGELKSFPVGAFNHVTHSDLFSWIENRKLKNKLQ
ncbi:hypothetical protein SDC9_58945 [bioreactor metagenome]|uniref:Helix-turn-helix domain-containing protein n=1 Tax=bioreactor metagenome TaxID=1076179 RepID=A0A644X9V3_9ZZZZ